MLCGKFFGAPKVQSFYKCEDCEIVFLHPDRLRDHNEEVHPETEVDYRSKLRDRNPVPPTARVQEPSTSKEPVGRSNAKKVVDKPTPSKKTSAGKQALIPCNSCEERFPSHKACNIHKVAVHGPGKGKPHGQKKKTQEEYVPSRKAKNDRANLKRNFNEVLRTKQTPVPPKEGRNIYLDKLVGVKLATRIQSVRVVLDPQDGIMK
jgi:hypothetical protein